MGKKDLNDIFEDLIIDELGDVSKNTNNEVSESIEDASDAKRQDTLINNEHVNILRQDNEELEKQVSSFRKLSDVLKKVKDLHSSSNDTKESPIITPSISPKSSSQVVTGEQILSEIKNTKSGAIDSDRTQIFVDNFAQGIEESLRQATNNAISNILIDLSKNPEKLGLLRKGIIANIENGLKGQEVRINNINTRRSIQDSAEQQRYQLWLKNHQSSSQYSRENTTVLSKNNENILTMRQLKTEFDILFKNVKSETKNGGLTTDSENELYRKSKEYKEDLKKSLDILGDKAKEIFELEDKLYKRNNTNEEQERLIKEINEATTDYNLILQNTVTTYKKANESMADGLKTVRLETDIINDPSVLKKKMYDNAKYALFRNKGQTRELQLNGYINNFNTTGNIADSFRKTLFNRATGYRQQRGLVGLGSNIGYNAGGVAPALALGAAATGLKKLGEVAVEFTKQSIEAYSQLEMVKTNLGIVYGSQSEANSAFNEIAQYATKSPFGVETVSQFAVQLKQSGVYASNLMTTLKQIGDVAGGNQQKFGNIANAFAQIEANGKATTRQLREFATAGIPIYAQLSKQLGKNVEQIRQMTAQGQISASIIEEAFSQLTGEGGMFHNAVNIGARTWAARTQNLADAKQLAQAQLGQWLINTGGTSSTDNDSIAKSFLNILEDIYSGVENFFLLKNIAKDVSAIESRDDDTRQLEAAIAYVSATGDKNLKDLLNKQLEQKLITRNYSQERATNAQSVALYIDAKENADLIKESINQYSEESEKINKNKLSMEENEYLFLSGNIRNTLFELNDEFSKFKRQMSKTSKFFSDEVKLNDYYISKVEAYTQKGFDTLSTYATKGSGVLSEVGTPNSLYKMYQDSIERAKQTPAGKLRVEQQQEREWEEMRKKYDELSPYLDKTATLTEDNVISLEKLSKILKSGIINPLEKFDLTPERMSNNKYKAKSVGRTVEQNEADWKEFSKKIDSLRNIDLRGFSDKDIENLQDVFAKMFGGKASDFTISTNSNGTKTFDKVSNFEEEVKNTEKNVKAFNTVFALFIKSLEKDNEEIAKVVEAYLSSKGQIAGKPDAFKELNPKTDPYPLWQRIISSSLGVDLNLFKNSGSGKGWATNGSQALDLYQKQMEKQTIKSVLNATISSMGVKKALDLVNKPNNYSGSAYSVSNNSQDGTKQIDWKELYKSTKDFAMSLEVSSEVTRAYADSLSQSQSALSEFLSSSITQMEEPANIWDENYKSVLGKYAENIKAVDANAFDMLFEDLGDGVYRMRENAVNAAKNLYELQDSAKKAAEATAEMKSNLKNLKNEISNTKAYNEILVNRLGNTVPTFSELNTSNSDAAVKEILSNLNAEKNKEGSLLKKLDIVKAFEYYIKNRQFNEFENNVNWNPYIKMDEQLSLNKNRQKYFSNLYGNIDELKSKFNNSRIVETPDFQRYASAEEKEEKNKERNLLENDLKIWERLIEEQKKIEDKLKELETTFKIEESSIEDTNKIMNLISQTANAVIDKYQVNERTEAINMFNSAITNPTKVYNPLLDGDQMLGNKFHQQDILNKYNYEGSWNSFRNSLITNEDGSFDSKFIMEKLLSSKSAQNNKELEGILNIMDLSENPMDGSLNLNNFNESLEELKGNAPSVFKAIIDELDKVILREMEMGDSTKSLVSAFEEVGKASKDALKNNLLNGYDQTMQNIGKNAKQLTDQTITEEEATKRLSDTWKNVGAEMLNSIGTAMTHTGLTLIAEGAKKGQSGYGMMAAGAALVAAGGVTQIMGGFFSADNDSKDKDKNKQEEERLKSLRDLLKEIIDQAKTDSIYYENNMRHKNALSVQSVNDAIITPNGSVVTTHPDDYLIATKTPGSLIGNGAQKSETKVSLTVVNASGTPVQAEEKSRKIDKDGNVEIELILTNAIGQKIANGEMDGFFDAREARIRGNSYIG